VTLQREWHDGDTVKIQLPMKLHTEFLPGVSNEIALLYGPLVLAGELGTNAMPVPFATVQTEFSQLPVPSAPMLVTAADDLLKHVKPVRGQALTFHTDGIGRPQDVTLIPFYKLHRQRYSVYWRLISEADWKAQSAEIAAAEARRMAEEARMVDVVRPGEQQSETDHKLQFNNSQTGDSFGRKWRQATGWFSYEVRVLPDQPQELVIKLRGDARARNFDVLVDGNIVVPQADRKPMGVVYDAVISIPPKLTNGKQSVTVTLAAQPGNVTDVVYEIQMLKTKPRMSNKP